MNIQYKDNNFVLEYFLCNVFIKKTFVFFFKTLHVRFLLFNYYYIEYITCKKYSLRFEIHLIIFLHTYC